MFEFKSFKPSRQTEFAMLLTHCCLLMNDILMHQKASDKSL